ncbi:hypothetical protein DL96DRAFT_1599445 [Flagelloscypha sp. PMI_526]|nr:hypothetical protein DL96DRAFT_1599445 [Flagelloscypha sp. PMI_526]
MSFSEGSGLWMPNMGAMNELMVGDKDGDGNRRPRRNCIFYVNQRPPTTSSDPNWAKERAKQFAQLMNLAQAGSDYHTLYDVFDLEEAFNPATAGPMADAMEAGLTRPWFQATSAGYANLCEGTVYLVVEEEEIWDQAIWMTHERDALWNSGRITQVVEIRPADIGRVYDGGGASLSQIPHHPYRGGQPPGATPPRDIDTSEVPAGIKADPNQDPNKKALDAIGNPDVSGDPDAPPISICPGYNFGIIDLGFDGGSGKEGYAVVDASCKQVAGAITSNVCTDPLFSCSPAPIKITTLHFGGQNYACRGDSRAGRCPGNTVDVQYCCRNDGN